MHRLAPKRDSRLFTGPFQDARLIRLAPSFQNAQHGTTHLAFAWSTRQRQTTPVLPLAEDEPPESYVGSGKSCSGSITLAGGREGARPEPLQLHLIVKERNEKCHLLTSVVTDVGYDVDADRAEGGLDAANSVCQGSGRAGLGCRNSLELMIRADDVPRVARSSQPRAEGRNPFGIGAGRMLDPCSLTCSESLGSARRFRGGLAFARGFRGC